MKKIIFREDEILPFSRSRFGEMAGIPEDEKDGSGIMNISEEVRKKTMKNIEIKGNFLFCHSVNIHQKKIAVQNYSFESPYFLQIPNRIIKGICFYLFTIENKCEMPLDNLSPLECVYRDLWGTAYVDGTAEYIKKELRDTFPEAYLSESFGPGYFGMPVKENETFFNLLDGESLGMKLNDRGIFYPEKSCAGFFLITEEELKIDKACKMCIGNKQSCSICNINRSIK